MQIDRSFLCACDIAGNPDDAAIAIEVIAMARSLEFGVIAEGAGTEAPLRLLHRYRRDEMQGYCFSRSLPPGDFAGMPERRMSLGWLHINDG